MYVVNMRNIHVQEPQWLSPMGVAKPSPGDTQRYSKNVYHSFLTPDVDIPKTASLQRMLLPRLANLASLFSCMKNTHVPVQLYIMNLLKF